MFSSLLNHVPMVHQQLRKLLWSTITLTPQLFKQTSLKMSPETTGLVKDRVSVVLPVYNQGSFLPTAIDSILAQTYNDLDVIIVNDGSTDKTAQAFSLFTGDPRVKVLHQSNSGLPSALSRGFRHATGEFWTWTSADNLLQPSMIATLVDSLKRNACSGMVYADYSAIDDAGHPLLDTRWRPQNRTRFSSNTITLPRSTAGLATGLDNFIGPCFLYRGWIGKILGDYMPPQGVEDFEYWLRMSLFFPIAHCNNAIPLYEYRVHSGSISSTSGAERILSDTKQLMAQNRTRQRLLKRSLTAHCDSSMHEYLTARSPRRYGLAPFRVLFEVSSPWSHSFQYAFVAISAETMFDKNQFFAHYTGPLVVQASLLATGLEALSTTFSRPRTLYLVGDQRTASAIRAHSSAPIVDASSASAISAIRAFAACSLLLSNDFTSTP
jgi:glycosyltransferase involved in cell wall biosynthesis